MGRSHSGRRAVRRSTSSSHARVTRAPPTRRRTQRRCRRGAGREVAAGAAALGLAGFEMLGYPDGELTDGPELRARSSGPSVGCARRGGVPRSDGCVLRPHLREPPRPPCRRVGDARRGRACGVESAVLPRARVRRTTWPRCTCPARSSPTCSWTSRTRSEPRRRPCAVTTRSCADRRSCSTPRCADGAARRWVASVGVGLRRGVQAADAVVATRLGAVGVRPGRGSSPSRELVLVDLAPLAHRPQGEDGHDTRAAGATGRAGRPHRYRSAWRSCRGIAP